MGEGTNSGVPAGVPMAIAEAASAAQPAVPRRDLYAMVKPGPARWSIGYDVEVEGLSWLVEMMKQHPGAFIIKVPAELMAKPSEG